MRHENVEYLQNVMGSLLTGKSYNRLFYILQCNSESMDFLLSIMGEYVYYPPTWFVKSKNITTKIDKIIHEHEKARCWAFRDIREFQMPLIHKLLDYSENSQFKIVFYGENLPHVLNATSDEIDQAVVVPMLTDIQMSSEANNEVPGIFNWMFEGAKRYVINKDIVIPDSVRSFTQTWRIANTQSSAIGRP